MHHVASGEARYFREWSTLLEFMQGIAEPRVPNIETERSEERA